MNGYEAAALSSGGFSSSSTYVNGHDTLPPDARRSKAKSGAKVLYEPRKRYSRTSINSLTDTSQYQVEHLMTFILDRKDGMMSVDDGIRRLRLMDAKGKVWTQEMLLQVEERAVSLMDLETKNELENFPIGSIQHCQALMNSCSYDSILALVCKESGQSKPDLHLFQCDDIKANLIHADIESAMMDARGGKVKKRPEALKMILKSDGLIPPPPAAPAPEPPVLSNQLDVKECAPAWSMWTNEQPDYEGLQLLPDGSMADVSALRVDREVQILNHILDDIEFFVTKLQKAAEAASELSKRKRAKKGKKKGPGEGVLTLRSKTPDEEEFLDCLQKFKHAFNQLGKLKDQIQNPSAVDLVHFLFSPLRMVIQASGGVDLARAVVVPLLTRDAIDFLHASGTPEERHLWVTLGDGWTKSRLEWPKDQFFPACELRFRDGWEPPALPFVSASREQDLTQLAERIVAADVHRREDTQALQTFPPTDGYALSGSSYKRLQILDQGMAMAAFKHAVSHVDRSFDSDNKVPPKLFAKSKYDFVARNNTELTVLKDEILEVLDDRKQWWKVRNGFGATGYVPNNILEVTRAVDSRGEPIYSHTIQLMMPKKEFELFKQQLLGELNEKQTTRTDPLPTKPTPTPVPPIPTPPPPAPTEIPMPPLPPPATEPTRPPLNSHSRHNSSASSEAGVSAATREQSEQKPTGRRKSNMEEVQDELVHRLTLGRSTQKKFAAPSRSSSLPAFSITYDSSPDEVRAWLEAKGFSPVTISSLGVLTGAQLFSLNKEELKTVCPDDGARVFSQITVQKAALEESSGSELQEIMRRRQEKLAASTCDSGVESFDEGSAH